MFLLEVCSVVILDVVIVVIEIIIVIAGIEHKIRPSTPTTADKSDFGRII